MWPHRNGLGGKKGWRNDGGRMEEGRMEEGRMEEGRKDGRVWMDERGWMKDERIGFSIES